MALFSPEQEARLKQKKIELKISNEKYLRQHPELNDLLQEVVGQVERKAAKTMSDANECEVFAPMTRVKVKDADFVRECVGESNWCDGLLPFCGGQWEGVVTRQNDRMVFVSFDSAKPQDKWQPYLFAHSFPVSCLTKV